MTPIKNHLLLLLLISNFAYSQNAQTLNPEQVKNIATLSKLWGFLKYYHPDVAKGNYNWDEQFLTILPKVKEAKSKEELSAVYLNWINTLVKVKPCKSCGKYTGKLYFDKNFDLSWMQDGIFFTPELSQKLKYIEANRFVGKHHYITTDGVGAVEIINEPAYEKYDYPKQNDRLLSLAKYWNTVEYFSPYKYLTDTKWDDVLIQLIPEFWNAKDASGYNLALLKTAIKLDDSHAQTGFEQHFIGNTYIPARLKIIDGTVVIDKLYNDSLARIDDLKIGDILLKVDGKPVSDIIADKLPYISASNIESKLFMVQYYLAYNKDGNPKITYSRDGKAAEKTIHNYSNKDVFKVPDGPKWKLLENNIGYINMAVLKENDVDKMMKELATAKALIIDMRNYPDFLPYALAKYLNSDEKAFCKILVPDVSYPGKFTWNNQLLAGKRNKNAYKGKVAILVNEFTQSRAEFSAMMLQTADNAVTIGSRTAGADGNVTKFSFLGNYKSMISGVGVYYPDGTQTQRVGIKIDAEVKPTVKGIQAGRDEVLEKALDYLK